MKYFIYCRKSSEEDSKQIQSLGTQIRMLTEYAQSQNLQIVEIIQESRSARIDNNRPLFSRMLKRIQAGEAQGVVVVHIDRLARNMIELGELTKLMQQKFLLEMRTPSATYRTTADLLQVEILGVFAAQYSRELSDKVNAGFKSKLLRGEYLSQAPLGYLNTPNGLVPDSVRAPYIQEAFRLYSTGDIPLKKLAQHLYEAGFRTKAGRRAYKSVIERILKNKVYCGLLNHKGVLYPAKHEPLVSKELFDTVQDVLTGRNRSKKYKHDFLYRDYLYCSVCGCKMTATIKKGKYKYYYCTNGKGKCSQHESYQREKQVFSALLPVFADITLDEKLAELSLQVYARELKKKNSFVDKAKEQIQKQVEANEKKQSKLQDLYLEDGIALEKYKAKLQELKNEQVELQAQLSQHKAQDPFNTLELLQQFKKYACTVEKMFEQGNDEVKSELLKSVLWNCKMENGKVVSTRYKMPFALIKNAPQTAEMSEWRKRWDSSL